MRPYIEGAAGTITNTVNANQPYLDQMAGQIRGYLPGLGEKAFGDSPLMGAASGYAQDVLGGKYLGQNNPYLNDMASMARANVGDDINSMFSKSGRVGSDAHFADLGRGMSEAELGLRYQDYANERNSMNQMAGMSSGIEAGQYAGIAPFLASSQTAAGMPYGGISHLGMIGGLSGGYGTQTGSQPGGWGTQLASAAATALPFLLSDIRAKTNIVKLREDDDGLGWYEFSYKSHPNIRLEGVMAQEVAEKRPWAVGPTLPNGYMTVNYAKLSEAA